MSIPRRNETFDSFPTFSYGLRNVNSKQDVVTDDFGHICMCYVGLSIKHQFRRRLFFAVRQICEDESQCIPAGTESMFKVVRCALKNKRNGYNKDFVIYFDFSVRNSRSGDAEKR